MATVRRYSRSARVLTETQPTYKPSGYAQAEMFEHIKGGFEAGVEFLRPAVELEQTQLGEAQAIEDYANDSFEMRKPFTTRSAAYNKTGERLITNRAMMELEDGLRDVMKKADGRIGVLNAELDALRGKVLGELPALPGLRTAWLEAFERGANTSRRQTVALAERRAVAATRKAATDSISAVTAETERLALTAATPDELSAALAAGVETMAQYGPREEFTIGGVTYKADPSRAGIFTADQLNASADELALTAHELFLRADYERSDAPGEWAREFERTVLSGNSPLPPDKSLDMLSSFEAKARTDENQRLAQERAAAEVLERAAADAINPYVVAAENGLVTTMPKAEREALIESVSGNAQLLGEVQRTLAAADVIAEVNALSPAQRSAYIERVRGQIEADGVITADEASIINALSNHLTAARQAITRETVGVTAAEQMIASGSVPDDATIAAMRDRAAGNPTVARAVEVLAEANDMIAAAEGLTGAEREQWLATLDGQLAKLGAEGGATGAGAMLRLDALELVEKHFDKLGELAADDVMRFAAVRGIATSPMPEGDVLLGEVADVIVQRVGQVQTAAADYGNKTPVPLTSGELEGISDWLRVSPNSQRVAFVDRLINGLGDDQASAIFDKVGVDNPQIMAAGRVASTNPAASRAILAGIGAKVQGVTPTNVAAAETTRVGRRGGTFLEVLQGGYLAADEIEKVRSTAEAYAAGLATRYGRNAVTPDDLAKGFDVALGADEAGRGGIERVGSYGTTVLPTGIDGTRLSDALDALDDAALSALAGGAVTDIYGRAFSALELRKSIEGIRPLTDDLLMPLDQNGGLFMTPNGPLTISIRGLFGG